MTQPLFTKYFNNFKGDFAQRRGNKMYDDNYNDEIDDDFATEDDAYETEVDNRDWINALLKDINIDKQ